MDWVYLVAGVLVLGVAGRLITPAGASRQAASNFRAGGWRSTNLIAIRVFGLVLVVGGVYLIIDSVAAIV